MKPWGYSILLLFLLIEKCLQWFANPIGIIASYADDFLVIPLVMGAALWIHQKYISKKFVYSRLQILLYWALFSLVFEGIFPVFTPAFTADPIDLLAYAAGSIYFYFFINYPAVKINS